MLVRRWHGGREASDAGGASAGGTLSADPHQARVGLAVAAPLDDGDAALEPLVKGVHVRGLRAGE